MLVGPQPRLLEFFEAICTVEGRSIVANQEMILRFAWIKEEERKQFFVETKSIKERNMVPVLKKYPSVRDPTTFRMTSGFNVPKFEAPFIGKEATKKSMPFVFLHWESSKVWMEGLDGSLYWSPAALDIQVYRTVGDDKVWIRLEELM